MADRESHDSRIKYTYNLPQSIAFRSLMFSLGSNNRQKLSDADLVEGYRYSYDNSYIGDLFQRYNHMLFGVCMKYLRDEEKAKDAVMDVFEKVLLDLKKHDVQNFRTWVYSVAKNHCLMQIRKVKSADNRMESYKYSVQEIVEFDLPEHLNGESQEETDRRLSEAIEGLKTEQRECVRLYYFEKKSYEEIESMTGYSYNQVKSYLQNGKRNLKLALTKDNG